MVVLDVIFDGFFAAIAAVGFGAISNPPLRAFRYIAILAAIGHALRYSLMTLLGADITTASFCGALAIGMTCLYLARKCYCPMTVLYIPALLPMIPGKFAYNMIFSQLMFLRNMDVLSEREKYMEMFFTNSMVTATVIFVLAVGATLPQFLFPEKASSITRRN